MYRTRPDTVFQQTFYYYDNTFHVFVTLNFFTLVTFQQQPSMKASCDQTVVIWQENKPNKLIHVISDSSFYITKSQENHIYMLFMNVVQLTTWPCSPWHLFIPVLPLGFICHALFLPLFQTLQKEIVTRHFFKCPHVAHMRGITKIASTINLIHHESGSLKSVVCE